mmetsp:Transcript_5593/g.14155  ORF Transcript_5593/g.14155 Transcript_5593/m.14155 type:complete len:311 (+) Transcript_5593:82-1014(+)
MQETLSIRGMGDDSFVVVSESDEAKSAWPPWKHLLEDLADAKPTPSSLKLSYKNLGDAGAHRLAELLATKLCSLVSLDLSCTSIGSGGSVAIARALGTHTALKSLDISSNAVTDTGCAAFAKSLVNNSSLETLSLHACLIGDKGAAALADALKENSALSVVNLRQNYISDAGAVALAGAIGGSSVLTVLDVQSNSYRTEGRKALAAAYEGNPRVAQQMPLSWHTGSDSAEQRSRLAGPPRSLVSVDSAHSSSSSTTPTRVQRQGSDLQRKKSSKVTELQSPLSGGPGRDRSVAEPSPTGRGRPPPRQQYL